MEDIVVSYDESEIIQYLTCMMTNICRKVHFIEKGNHLYHMDSMLACKRPPTEHPTFK